MWKFLFYIFLAYSLYQLIFKFIIPVYRTTRQVKKGFRDMQERMNGHMQQGGYAASSATVNDDPKTATKSTGEYIDFEEVKD